VPGTFTFTAEELAAVEAIATRYPRRPAALLPVLHMVQQRVGHIPHDAMEEVARVARPIPCTGGRRSVLLYLYRDRPVGKYVIQICRNLPCSLRGSHELIEHAKQKLGIGEGQTTADQRFTLHAVECLAACDGAPCLQVNEDDFANVTPERFDENRGGLP